LCDVAITEFADKYFIIASNNGKVGSLVEISPEVDATKTSYIYNSKTIFGVDEPEVQAVGQSVVEMLKLKKPVLFGFSLKEYDAKSASRLKEIISQTLLKDSHTDSIGELKLEKI